jgi:hypothetical protein
VNGSRAMSIMQRMPTSADLSDAELVSLRDVVVRSFVTVGSISRLRRTRLLELGLIQSAMGGLMATPAGRMIVRM